MTFFLLLVIHSSSIYLFYSLWWPKIINNILKLVCMWEQKTWDRLIVGLA